MTAKRYRACVLATCCVPWDEDFGFAESIFRRQVRHLISSGIRDLYVFGTAGEGYAVTEAQFDGITAAFLDETRGDGVQSMVGLISLSLPAVIERIERARDMGARRFQLSLPAWGMLRDAEMEVFFDETCGRFPDCEFLHYNLPRTGRIVTGSEYGRLAGRHPNLVATKNSTSDEDRLRSLFADAPQLRHFITELGFTPASRMGECGLLMSVSGTNLALSLRYFEAACRQDSSVVAEIQREAGEIVAALKRFAGPEVHMDGAFDKMFCRIHDPGFPLRLLPPYNSVPVETFERFAALLQTRYPRWMPDRE